MLSNITSFLFTKTQFSITSHTYSQFNCFTINLCSFSLSKHFIWTLFQLSKHYFSLLSHCFGNFFLSFILHAFITALIPLSTISTNCLMCIFLSWYHLLHLFIPPLHVSYAYPPPLSAHLITCIHRPILKMSIHNWSINSNQFSYFFLKSFPDFAIFSKLIFLLSIHVLTTFLLFSYRYVPLLVHVQTPLW